MSLWNSWKNVSGANMAHSWLHPEEGYDAAQEELNKGWNEAKGYQQPYNEAGQAEIGRLRDATGRLLNPEELQNQWAQGYETSPFAKQQLERSKNLGMDAASSMGLNGSSSAIENIQRTGSGIVAQDRQTYLDNLMQKYLAGVNSSGNIFGTGAGVGNSMSQGAQQHAQDSAQMRYNSTNAPGNMFGGLIGTAASAAGTAMTGVPTNFNSGGGSGGSYGGDNGYTPPSNQPSRYRSWGSA